MVSHFFLAVTGHIRDPDTMLGCRLNIHNIYSNPAARNDLAVRHRFDMMPTYVYIARKECIGILDCLQKFSVIGISERNYFTADTRQEGFFYLNRIPLLDIHQHSIFRLLHCVLPMLYLKNI